MAWQELQLVKHLFAVPIPEEAQLVEIGIVAEVTHLPVVLGKSETLE